MILMGDYVYVVECNSVTKRSRHETYSYVLFPRSDHLSKLGLLCLLQSLR